MSKHRRILISVAAALCVLSFFAESRVFGQELVNCFPGAGTPELELLTLINNWRGSQGVLPVAPDPRLQAAALLHSQDMAAHGVLSHTGSDGSSFGDRIQAQGYPPVGLGEMVGFGYQAAAAFLESLVADEAHRNILADDRFRHIGIGLVNRYWTVDLGGAAGGPVCGGGDINAAPVLDPIGNQTVPEGGVVAITITAADADGDPLTFSAAGLPSFATFLDNGNGSATLTLTPTTGTIGTYEGIIFTVSDGNLADSETIVIDVTGNRPPVLGAIANFILMDGWTYTIGLSATDPDGDALSFAASGLPFFAAFHDNGDGTATLSISAPTGTTGVFGGVIFTVSDGLLTDSQQISITISRLCFPGAGTPELELLTLINSWRGSQGVLPVAPDPRLQAAALLHSQDMATHDFLGHTGSDGSSFGDRIQAQGYPSAGLGEMVGFGYQTAAVFLESLLADEAHRNILADGRFRHIGIGLVAPYWTVDLGGAADGPTCAGSSNLAPTAEAGQDQSGHLGLSFNLDGSGSSDPDGNYPLTFSWTVLYAPPGSSAAISNGDGPQPSLRPDVAGTYTIRLVVTDSLGQSSEPDTVLVSTANAAPVAEAGPDQAILLIGATVELDGRSSYDLDGDDLSYQWQMLAKPSGSEAVLSSPISATPAFVADVRGDYQVQLIVRDAWSPSAPDIVQISFDNVAPVAVAGGNQAVPVEAEVLLDGSGSYDANLDPLTYRWSLVSRPEGSIAALAGGGSVRASFVADKAGSYIVSLVVSDGTADSEVSTVTVTAVVSKQQVVDTLTEAIDRINGLPPEAFQNGNMQKALTNKIMAVLRLIDQGSYAEALEKLRNDILQKMDGCAGGNAPDKNDWLVDCVPQSEIYRLVVQAIWLLEGLV